MNSKNLIYISPQFPRNYIQFVLSLRRIGVQVLGLGSDWFEQLPYELRGALSGYYRVNQMDDYQQMLQGAKYFEDRFGSICRIESHTEYWLPTEAALREDLGVWGKNREETSLMRRKSSMKEVYKKAGIPVAQGQLISTEAEAASFAQAAGYPLIFKPDEGVGAAATFKIHNPEELAKFFRDRPSIPYFMEEFVEGDICTFDGLCNHDGDIVYCNSLVYSNGIMEVVNHDKHVYYYTARNIAADLEEAGRKTVKAFDVREKFFHLEFFRRKHDGVLLGLEVNIRPPGGFTTDMWNYADDISMYDQWASIVAYNRFEAQWSRKWHAIYISRKDHIHYRHSHQEVLNRLGHMLCHTERIPELFSRALGNTGYIMRSGSLDEVLEAAHLVQQS